MNLLVNRLPTTDKFGRTVRTSFRYWINFLRALSDEEIEPDSRLLYALTCVYVDDIDVDAFDEYREGAFWFLNGGKDPDEPADGNHAPILDYDIDQMVIYSSFMSYYHINLTRAQLHWFEFRALMYTLPQDTPVGALMYYRGKEVTSDMPDWERKQVQRLKRLCRIKKKSDDEWVSEEDFIKAAAENWQKLKGNTNG